MKWNEHRTIWECWVGGEREWARARARRRKKKKVFENYQIQDSNCRDEG